MEGCPERMYLSGGGGAVGGGEYVEVTGGGEHRVCPGGE